MSGILKIKAEFIGKDGSEGFRHHTTYELSFQLISIKDKTQIKINTPDKGSYYESMKSFLKNWKIL